MRRGGNKARGSWEEAGLSQRFEVGGFIVGVGG